MNISNQISDIIRKTRILRSPRRHVATFGNSVFNYNLVTSSSPAEPRSTLRTGRVTAERPRIITPQSFISRFEGFGDGSGEWERLFLEHFQEAFRGLEYVYRNQLLQTLPHQMRALDLARNIQQKLDRREASQTAVICGPENGWQVSLMKFISEETSHSFPTNVRELEERGFFDPAQAVIYRQRKEIESLFRQSQQNPSNIRSLGSKLKEYNLFEEYQDRFFALINR